MLTTQQQQNSSISSEANVILFKMQAGDEMADVIREIDERKSAFGISDLQALIYNCLSNTDYIEPLKKVLQLYFESSQPLEERNYMFLRGMILNIVEFNNLTALEVVHEKLVEFDCLDNVAEYLSTYQECHIIKIALNIRNAAVLKFIIENFSVSDTVFCNLLLPKDSSELLAYELRLYEHQVSLFRYLLENTIMALIKRAYYIEVGENGGDDEEIEEDIYEFRQLASQAITTYFEENEYLLRTVINKLHVEAAKLLLDAKESLVIFSGYHGDGSDARLAELINPIADKPIMNNYFPFNSYSAQAAKFFLKIYNEVPHDNQQAYKEMLAILLDNHCFLGVYDVGIPNFNDLNLKGGGLAWSGEPVMDESVLVLDYENIFFDIPQDIQNRERKHLDALFKYIINHTNDPDYCRLLQVRVQQAIKVEESRSDIQAVHRRQDYVKDLRHVLKFIKLNQRSSLKYSIIAKLNTPSFFTAVVESSPRKYFNNDGSFAIPLELQELIPDTQTLVEKEAREKGLLPNDEAVVVLRQRVKDIRSLAWGLEGPKQRKTLYTDIFAFVFLIVWISIESSKSGINADDGLQTFLSLSGIALLVFFITRCSLCCWSGYSQWSPENMLDCDRSKFESLLQLIELEAQLETPLYAELKSAIEILFSLETAVEGDVVGNINGEFIECRNKDLAFVLNCYADKLEKKVNDLEETDLPFKVIDHRIGDSFQEEVFVETENEAFELVTVNLAGGIDEVEEIEIDEIDVEEVKDDLRRPLLPK